MKRQTKPRSWTDENFLRLVAAWQAGGIAACCEAFPQLNKHTLKTIIHNYVRNREIGETDEAPSRPSTRSTYTAHDAWANKMLRKKWIIA